MLLLHATAKEGVEPEQLERAIDDEIARLVSGGTTEDELTRAKNRAEVDFAHQIENHETRADTIGMLATYFGDPTMIHRWLDPYQAATAAELTDVAARYLVASNRATSVFVPTEGA